MREKERKEKETGERREKGEKERVYDVRQKIIASM